MTEQDLVKAIGYAISTKDKVASEDVALSYLNMAIQNIGKMTGVDFNRKTVTFNLTSGRGSYIIGKDILSGQAIVNVQDLYRTDVPNWNIKMTSVEDFNAYTKGGVASGAPQVATIDRDIPDELILKVYPIPASAYPCSATARIAISTLQHIPERFRPALYAEAVNLFNTQMNPAVAMQLAKQSKDEIRSDGYTAYSGNQIDIERVMYRGRGGRRATSYNLTDN